MRPYAVSTVMIALVVSLASASAAQSPSTPPNPRPAPPTPSRAAIRSDAPGESFAGTWSSDKDPSGVVFIRSLRSATISIAAAGRFEAVGYVSGSTGLALASIPGPPLSVDLPVRYAVLRIERRDERTLHVSFADDLHGAPTGEETWTFGDRRQEHPSSPNIIDAPPDGGSPKFGDYVYVEELPEAITKVTPVYPDRAREQGIDGQVLVQALVGKDGLVRDVRIISSIPSLDDAAVAALRQWRFKPALTKGVPVAVWVAIPVKFSLH